MQLGPISPHILGPPTVNNVNNVNCQNFLCLKLSNLSYLFYFISLGPYLISHISSLQLFVRRQTMH